jgi:SAM-dependent methyltransferase
MRIALRIAPQHSTQYADMTRRLAAPELLASPAATSMTSVQNVQLGGADYLVADLLAGETPEGLMPILTRLGATQGVFELLDGPLLRPVEPTAVPHVPIEMAEARRYKGKTSEVFSRVLLNLALFGGAFADRLESRLRILDPLSGGGTTLFLALAAGYDAFGVEQDRRALETTVAFVREFCREERLSFSEVHEKANRRHRLEIGPRDDRRLLVVAQGDTRTADVLLADVPGGARFHAIAADLPYGIQHDGAANTLVAESAAAWERTLHPGGALALAWDATRLRREALAAAIESGSSLVVRDDEPYASFEHRVDRVIKRRDVIVAVKPEP